MVGIIIHQAWNKKEKQMAKVTRTPLEKDLRKAYKEAYNDLSSIGNGYGWAAEEVLAVLAPVIKKYAEDFDIDKVW